MIRRSRKAAVTIAAFLCTCLTCGNTFSSVNVYAADNMYREIILKEKQPLEKEWTIKLSEPVKDDFINDSYIKLSSVLGKEEKVPISVSKGQESNTIIIGAPASGYIPGMSYCLTIDKGLQAQEGSLLNPPVKLKFTTDDNFTNGSKYEELPSIKSCTFVHTPLLPDQKQEMYLTASGGQVQYRVFIHSYSQESNKYEEITNDYTSPVDGNTPLKITASKELKASQTGQKYKVLVFVKRAGVKGKHSTNIAGINEMDFDNYYVDYFRGVNSTFTKFEDLPMNMNLEQAVNSEKSFSCMTNEGQDGTNNWVNANTNMIRYYINPENFKDDCGKLMFMRLDKFDNSVKAEDLNILLKGKGMIEGKGQAFIDAAKKYDINPVYLLTHSINETAGGISALSKGVIIEGKTVYNFFGVRAVDGDVINSGAKFAYEHGWFTPEKAIEGGANYITLNYIRNPLYNQNTIYKMRWNLQKPGANQYATDIAWAYKIALFMKPYVDKINMSAVYEVPQFKK